MEGPYKFGWIPDEERTYEYPHIWAVEKTTGPDRLVIAPSRDHISLMLELMSVMPEPFGILYVLVVPRGEGEPGRYQTPTPVSSHEARQFLTRFKEFFEKDGRCNIWVASMANSDQVIYDRHNVLYAYGQLPAFEGVLLSRGLPKADSVSLPVPHIHQYHEEFDHDAREVLRVWPWKHFPLQDQDN